MFNQGDQPIAGYRLQRFLGRGQFGEVWAADGPGGTLVALKFIALQQKTGIRELKSIQAVKRIKHANLCSVNAMWLLGEDGSILDDQEIDLLIHNQTAPLPSQTLSLEATQTLNNPRYLVVSMALADGSLDQRLKEVGGGGIPRDELLDYMQQAARGIDFLNAPRHQVGDKLVGIQHRDIKPANLLFAGDSVLVGDFGVAAAFGEYDTEATSVVGSLCYMSPESIKRIPSHASDQYALAITYYQLRTGTLPFEPTVSFAELVDIHVRGKLRFEHVSAYEQEILAKATATDARQRYSSCVEFVTALAAPAPEEAPAEGLARFKFPALIGGSLAAMLLLSAIIWTILGGAEATDAGPSPAAFQTHTLIFSPEQTRYQIEIVSTEPRAELAARGISSAPLKLLPTDQLRITAQPENPLYAALDKELTYEQLIREDWHLKLAPLSAEAMLSQISQRAVEGEWDEARTLFQQARQVRPEIASQPEAAVVRLADAPAIAGMNLHQGLFAMALSGDGSSSLAVLDLENWTNATLRIPLEGLPYQLYLLGDSPLAVSVEEQIVAVTPLKAANPTYRFDLGQPTDIPFRQITAAALAPDRKSLLFGQNHQQVTLLRLSSEGRLTEDQRAPFPARVDVVAYTPDGATIVALGGSGQGRRWPVADLNASSGKAFELAGVQEQVLALHAVSSDQLYVLTDSQLLLATLSASAIETTIETITVLSGSLTSSRMTGDHKFLVYSTQNEARPLSIVDTTSKQVTSIRPPDIRGTVEDFDLSPDGRYVVYADSAGALFAFDLSAASARPLPLLATQNQRMKFVRISQDGQYVVTVAESGTVTRWNFVQLLLMAISDSEPDDS